MKPIENNGRKDMGDLKQDIIDAANTSKEIIQDQIRDTKAGGQIVADKTQEVMREIKQAAIKIARVVAAPGEPVDPVELNTYIKPETGVPGAYARTGGLPGDPDPVRHTQITPGMPDSTTQIIGTPSQAEVDLVMKEGALHETKN